MRRYQLFEFGDQPWMRGWLREAYLDALNFALRVGGQYRGMHIPLVRWAAIAGSQRVLDLASGGGGPVETVVRQAQRDHVAFPTIVLSDLYPSPTHYEDLAAEYGSMIDYVSEPVSATHVPMTDIRLRSLCSAFHHFRPSAARQVIEDAAKNSDGIFILEPFDRSFRQLLLILLAGPFIYMFAPFFCRRFTIRKFLVCTLLPIIPFMLLFDGCVSVLRMYTPSEIEAMFPKDVRAEFICDRGGARYMGIFRSSYFCAARRN
jgi:hypothetical protein